MLLKIQNGTHDVYYYVEYTSSKGKKEGYPKNGEMNAEICDEAEVKVRGAVKRGIETNGGTMTYFEVTDCLMGR